MSEWISVKDRLPEDGQDILYVVRDRGSEPYVMRGSRAYEAGTGYWWCDEDGEFDESGNEPGFSTVTHWMPLPEPPKEQP
jgi:Protein of unknown function (DUF551)